MARMRYMLGAVFVVLMLGMCGVSVAYAEGGGGSHSFQGAEIIYGPSAAPVGDNMQVAVYADNRYVAAFLALGYDYSDYTTLLDDEKKALLSNESTGGAFYTLAQGFTQTLPWYIVNVIYNPDYVWFQEYTQTLIGLAKQDLQKVLDGEVTGGTGSGIESGDYVLSQSSKPTSERAYIAGLNESGNDTLMMRVAPETCKLTIKGGLQEAIEEKYNDGYDLFIVMNGHWSNVSTKNTVSIYMLQPNTYTLQNVTYNDVTYPNLVSNPSIEYYSRSRNYTSGTYENGALDIEMNLTGSYASLSKLTNSINILVGGGKNSSGTNNYGGYYLLLKADGTSSNPQNPTIPPTQWPETPENPTVEPPTVPNPPEVEPPTEPVVPPDNPVVTYPIVTYEPDVTYQTPDLSAVLDAMNQHCRHLQSAIHVGFNDFWVTLDAAWDADFATLKSFLRGLFVYLGDTIKAEMLATRDYLKELFEWLAEQLDFTFAGGSYDDSSLLTWLKRIYSKLGTGGINTRPVDPVANPFDFAAWLSTLFASFVNGLLALGANELAGITGALQELTTKFPFSVPWDIAALLGLLVASPVTPEFDVPQYALTSGGLAQVGTYHIDLEYLDTAWEGVRLIEKIAFGVFLAWQTPRFRAMLSRGDGE